MPQVAADQDTKVPGAAEVFEKWMQNKMRRDKGGCSPESVPIYRAIWDAWLTWLTTQDVAPGPGEAWRRAQAAHVRKFIEGPAPAEGKRRREPKDEARMANYTRQRYYSALRDIYDFACDPKRRWCPANPANGDKLPEEHRINLRDRTSQVLPPGVLPMLRDPEQLAKLLPKKAETNWWIDRDRAVVALLAHFGLTKSELIDLQGHDLRRQMGRVYEPHEQLRLDEEPNSILLNVYAPDRTAKRLGAPFKLTHEVLAMLRPWLLQRRRLLAAQRARMIAGQRSADRMPAPDEQQPLFLARIPAKESGCLPAMEGSTVYQLVNRCLDRAYAMPAVSKHLDEEAIVAKGPGIVRNSVIRHWIETLGAEQAALLAGIKEQRHLRHPDAVPAAARPTATSGKARAATPP